MARLGPRGLQLVLLVQLLLPSAAAAATADALGHLRESSHGQWRFLGAGSACGGRDAPSAAASELPDVGTASQCRILCEESADCQAVEFTTSTQVCRRFGERVRITHLREGAECWSRAPDALGSVAAAGTEVFVMLPLDTVSSYGSVTHPEGLPAMLDKLRSADIDGFMVDVWWGLTERIPRVYNFSAYRQVFELARSRGWQVQAVASFHQCGGNEGDRCNIPLPEWVHGKEGIWYKDAGGAEDREYISLFADDVEIEGRTPLAMYRDWMEAFAADFADDMGPGGLIAEVMVGMGPCGELRYPSYQLSHWRFCGIGEFQAHDAHALRLFQAAAEGAGHPEWASPPGRASAGSYLSHPRDTEFFQDGFRSEYGRFFLDWYSASLKQHGQSILAAARQAFPEAVEISGKIAGIHWWYDTESHAAELTAGYYNTNFRDAYAEIAEVFAKSGATMDFTCLEMRNTEQPQEKCRSNPENLVAQVAQATEKHGLPLAGENALARYDRTAYAQIVSQKPHLHSFTYLRLDHTLVGDDNLDAFREFVSSMHGPAASLPAEPSGSGSLRR